MRLEDIIVSSRVTPVTEPCEATIPAFVEGEPIRYSTHPLIAGERPEDLTYHFGDDWDQHDLNAIAARSIHVGAFVPRRLRAEDAEVLWEIHAFDNAGLIELADGADENRARLASWLIHWRAKMTLRKSDGLLKSHIIALSWGLVEWVNLAKGFIHNQDAVLRAAVDNARAAAAGQGTEGA